ncbi:MULTISPECIES: hypothetical protein [unclassified Shewanella]|uniref:hypothetical protein n=1 Tax=unclassified Shewanella TaxID=196818 RepID=UPI000C838408|nr:MULTISPECIES: hypothetical protein [unclassified Shewanella]MDO6680581.1 hypothetical protein [Shewanella sp. 4_MG-2023]PMG51079.1 hypothetical protein BCU91_16925 [Shewanella sp. 10N.286.52.B9]
MKFLIFFISIVSFSAISEQWYENGEIAPERSFQGGIGDFGAMVFMTTNSQKMLDNWEVPTDGYYVTNDEEVEKGQPIEALVVFYGCKANEKGNCVAEVDYRIVKPDGSVYTEIKDTELWKNKPAMPEGQLGLAVDRVGLIAELGDPVGVYTVELVIRDLVSNNEFPLYSSFKVIEANK